MLGLIVFSDVSVQYDSEIYGTDAFCRKVPSLPKVSKVTVAEVLWLGGDRHGAYTLSDNFARKQVRTRYILILVKV